MENKMNIDEFTNLKNTVLKAAITENPSAMMTIDYSKDNFNTLFPRSRISTPVENVKFGSHQFAKFSLRERRNLIAAVYETLRNPDVVIAEKRENDFGELEDSHNYAKNFMMDAKSKMVQSVIVEIENDNVIITSHERPVNEILSKIEKAEQLIYISPELGSRIEQHTQNEQSVVNSTQDRILKNKTLTINKDYIRNDDLSIVNLLKNGKLTNHDVLRYGESVGKETITKINRVLQKDLKPLLNENAHASDTLQELMQSIGDSYGYPEEATKKRTKVAIQTMNRAKLVWEKMSEYKERIYEQNKSVNNETNTLTEEQHEEFLNEFRNVLSPRSGDFFDYIKKINYKPTLEDYKAFLYAGCADSFAGDGIHFAFDIMPSDIQEEIKKDTAFVKECVKAAKANLNNDNWDGWYSPNKEDWQMSGFIKMMTFAGQEENAQKFLEKTHIDAINTYIPKKAYEEYIKQWEKEHFYQEEVSEPASFDEFMTNEYREHEIVKDLLSKDNYRNYLQLEIETFREGIENKGEISLEKAELLSNYLHEENQKAVRPTAEQIVDGVESGWDFDDVCRGYIESTNDFLPNVLTILRIDDMMVFESDEDAAKQAEKDGIKLIPKTELHFSRDDDARYYRYVDTVENRKLLQEAGILKEQKNISEETELYKKSGLTDFNSSTVMFISDNYPDYTRSNTILESDILQRYIDGELLDENNEPVNTLEKLAEAEKLHFDSEEELRNYHIELDKGILEASKEAYEESLKLEVEDNNGSYYILGDMDINAIPAYTNYSDEIFGQNDYARIFSDKDGNCNIEIWSEKTPAVNGKSVDINFSEKTKERIKEAVRTYTVKQFEQGHTRTYSVNFNCGFTFPKDIQNHYGKKEEYRWKVFEELKKQYGFNENDTETQYFDDKNSPANDSFNINFAAPVPEEIRDSKISVDKWIEEVETYLEANYGAYIKWEGGERVEEIVKKENIEPKIEFVFTDPEDISIDERTNMVQMRVFNSDEKYELEKMLDPDFDIENDSISFYYFKDLKTGSEYINWVNHTANPNREGYIGTSDLPQEIKDRIFETIRPVFEKEYDSLSYDKIISGGLKENILTDSKETFLKDTGCSENAYNKVIEEIKQESTEELKKDFITAISHGNNNLIKELVPSVNSDDKQILASGLFTALENNNTEAWKTILDSEKFPGEIIEHKLSLLHDAAADLNVDLIDDIMNRYERNKELLSKLIFETAGTINGQNALNTAINRWHDIEADFSDKEIPEAIKLLSQIKDSVTDSHQVSLYRDSKNGNYMTVKSGLNGYETDIFDKDKNLLAHDTIDGYKDFEGNQQTAESQLEAALVTMQDEEGKHWSNWKNFEILHEPERQELSLELQNIAIDTVKKCEEQGFASLDAYNQHKYDEKLLSSLTDVDRRIIKALYKKYNIDHFNDIENRNDIDTTLSELSYAKLKEIIKEKFEEKTSDLLKSMDPSDDFVNIIVPNSLLKLDNYYKSTPLIHHVPETELEKIISKKVFNEGIEAVRIDLNKNEEYVSISAKSVTQRYVESVKKILHDEDMENKGWTSEKQPVEKILVAAQKALSAFSNEEKAEISKFLLSKGAKDSASMGNILKKSISDRKSPQKERDERNLPER